GDLFDLDITLDSLIPSIGQMTMTLDDVVTPSGTFESFFDVFVEIIISDAVTNTVVQTISGLPGLRLEGGGSWTSVAPPNAVIVAGPPGDTTANTHDPLAPDTFDFYIDGLVTEEHPSNGARHVARNSIIPEPGTTTLLCLGALGMGIRRRWHQGKRKPLSTA
ncbi:MAG: PEP-CTERM sorting domain-containing protein, partial [Candidatus Hydrogenedentes bacterium]|nr:PEP-CTERM sorting domain-containing protein [Candidatus Hydrogenedentota bacterium]